MTTGPAVKTVVVADDTGFVRDRFRTALEQAGHRAIAVRSAVELLARVRADIDRIDLVVLDLRLPSTPGLDLVRALRKIDEGRLTVLVFSGTIASAVNGRPSAWVKTLPSEMSVLPVPHSATAAAHRRSTRCPPAAAHRCG